MNKDSEEILDQLLRGLRDVEAPAGMKLRILNAIAHPAKQRQHGAPWSVPRIRPWHIALGAAAATILLLAFVLDRPAEHPATPPVPAQARIQPTPSLPHALPALASEAAPPPSPTRTPAKHHQAPSLDAEEQLCLRELRTPSQPEPPTPLTAEEKILLRIAHTAAPEEIALLNPEIRAQQQASSAAEFERFAQSSANENQENK